MDEDEIRREAGGLGGELLFDGVSWIAVTGCSWKVSSEGVVGDVLLFPGGVLLCPPCVVGLACRDWFSLSDRFTTIGLAERRMLSNFDGRLPPGSGELGRLPMDPKLALLKEDIYLDGYSIRP